MTLPSIAVVNLDRSGDRRGHMEGQLDPLGLSYFFFSATDAARGDLEGINRYCESQTLRLNGRPLTLAEQGCYASHYRLWQRIADTGESLIVMEDDVTVDPSLVTALPLIGQLLDQRHFLRLCGTLNPRRYRHVAAVGDHHLIRFMKGPRGTQCYALDATGARYLLQRASIWTEAVDLYLDAYWTHGLPSWALIPFHVHDQEKGSLPSLIDHVEMPRRAFRRKLQREWTQVRYTFERAWFNLKFIFSDSP